MKSRPHRRNRKFGSSLRRQRVIETLESRELLAVDGLSPAVQAAFERAADIYETYSRAEILSAQQWVILMSDGSNQDTLADELNASTGDLTPAGVIPNTFIVDGTTIADVDPSASPGTGGLPLQPPPEDVLDTLESIDTIEYFYPMVQYERAADYLPLDEFFPDQWHLRNIGQTGGSPGADANVENAWDVYTGRQVVIAVVDDGLQGDHPDLARNFLPALSWDYVDGDEDPSPVTPNDDHGTAVAGVAAAVEGNLNDPEGGGVVGVAFNAGLAGIRFLGGPVSEVDEVNALTHLPQWIDIYNNSWGPGVAASIAGPSPLVLAGMEQSIAAGRAGLGSIYVFSGGNDQMFDDDVNYNGYANSRFTIAVAAVGDDGRQSYYSNPGAPILVSGHSDNEFTGITTTDLTGDAGASDTDYRDDFGGTSSAAPLVSGGIALMLEANDELTWRDVQHIIVQSAAFTDPTDDSWGTNAAGHQVSHKYGFGVFDAEAAVTLASTWVNVEREDSVNINSPIVSLPIPDNDDRGVSTSLTVNSELQIETIEIEAEFDHNFRGDLEIVLTSPSGTESVLATQHGKQDSGDYNDWVFSTVHHWDESSLGDWTLTVRDLDEGGIGTLESWRMFIHGVRPPSDDIVGGTVTGFKWNDADGDGVRDLTEPGLGQWRIFADLDNNGFLNVGEPSTVTTASGAYTLEDIPAGTHVIREQLKSGWEQTFPAAGGHAIQIVANQTITDLNFGNRQVPGRISGIKWNDLNADGVLDDGESGVEGITIYLDANSNGELDSGEISTRTDSEGRYLFTDLEPGVYRVAEVGIPGVEQTYPLLGFHSLDLIDGQQAFDLNFGNALGIESVFGSTWLDVNGNGEFDSGEPPMEGVIVYVDADDDGRIGYAEPSTITGEDGGFFFDNIGTHAQSVRAVIEPGMNQTTPADDAGYAVQLTPGSASANLNFGFGTIRDLGDAPAPYPTRLIDNGPVHPIDATMFLGASIDAELDAIGTTLSANADDLDGLDDEDGIVFATPLTAGNNARLRVTASKQGFLQGWIDFNSDGDWLDEGEQVFRDTLVSAGSTNYMIEVPTYAVDGTSYARFRLSHNSGVNYYGPAFSGEVEDYRVTIENASAPTTPANAENDLFSAVRDSSNNLLAVLANDAMGGVGLTIDAIGDPDRGGTAVLAGDGRQITYTPASQFVGDETFVYTVRNAQGETDSALVTITVRAALNAVNDSFTTDQDTSDNALDVLFNDTITTGGTASIVDTGPTNADGTVSIASDGKSLLYTPAVGYVGAETFTYTVSDSLGGSDTATVTIDVRSVTLINAANDTFAVDSGSSNNTLKVLANDTAPIGTELTITDTSSTSNGGVVQIASDGKSVLYAAPSSGGGTDTFTYTITDGAAGTDTAFVTINLTEPTTVTANNDGDTVALDSSENVIDVLANDSITGGGSLVIESVGATNRGGQVQIALGGTRLLYTPALGFSGTETFDYTASNGAGVTDTATVTIAVLDAPPNDRDLVVRLATTDVAGNLVSSVNVGETFVLNGYLQDVRATPTGVFAIWVDIELNESGLATANSAIDHGTRYVIGTSGTIEASTIDEVGGINDMTTGDGSELLFFSVEYEATATGSLTFTPESADISPLHDILFFTPLVTVDFDTQVDARSTTLVVNAFTNNTNGFDVDGNNFVTAMDALIILNELNTHGARAINGNIPQDRIPAGFVDTNSDGFVSAVDALLVINELNRLSSLASVPMPTSSPESVDAALLSDSFFDDDDDDDDSIDLFADDVSKSLF